MSDTCVCLCVNQGGTNHCTWRLVILCGNPDISRHFLHSSRKTPPMHFRLDICPDNSHQMSAEHRSSVASLGWVTPGAATEGVTPLFFLKNLATFFCSSRHYHYRFFLLSLGCYPLRVSPHTFTCPTSFLHYSL